jgi:hypothetical protein
MPIDKRAKSGAAPICWASYHQSVTARAPTPAQKMIKMIILCAFDVVSRGTRIKARRLRDV